MILIFILLGSASARTAISYPPGWPLEKTKIELLTAGTSSETVDGLLDIAFYYQFPILNSIEDKQLTRKEYDVFMMELDIIFGHGLLKI